MSQSPTKVTVVVPCRNERTHIAAFVSDTFAQDWTDLEYEVLIADGMSDDGTAQLLQELAKDSPRLQVVQNLGRIVSTGLNEAIRRAKGDIIIRMDVHARYARDYVQQCIRTLKETGAENVGGPPLARAETYWGRAVAAAFHSPFAVGGAASHDLTHEGSVDTVCFGCWKRQTLIDVGLFDETLVRNQDDELNYRLVKSGGRIYQSPKIQSWYQPRDSLSRLARQYFQYGFWKVAVLKKHRRPAKLRHLVPGLFCLLLAGLPLLAGISSLLGLATAAQALLALSFLQLALYIGLCAMAAAMAGRRNGWSLIPGVFCAIPCFHFGYGIGFLTGLVMFSARLRHSTIRRNSAFSSLSR